MHRLLVRGLASLLLIALPASTHAQFISITQLNKNATATEQRDIATALTEINAKGTKATQQVQAVLAEVATKNLGPSPAARKTDVIVTRLKGELNDIVQDYAKKNPPGSSVRAVFDAAQDTLNAVRKQATETLDQAGFDQAAKPGELSGKYLDYQKQIKELADKGIVAADERLNERGSKQSVKKALERIILETQQKIDIATTGFLSTNPDVLSSAIERIKKGVLDDLSKAMAERFKSADQRGSDKALDLSEEEQERLETELTEANRVVDTAIKTVDTLFQQIAQANLPTSTNVAGVNPLLEAKFTAGRREEEVSRNLNRRLDTILERFNNNSENSQLAKDVFAREMEKLKNRYNDTTKEYKTYFFAGDPSQAQYQRAKKKLQEKAEGCDGFLCSIGRVVSGAASGLLSLGTKGVVNLPPNLVSNNIFGIKDPVAGIGGAYSGNYNYGIGVNKPFDPRCLSQAEQKQETKKKFAFIERAQAQQPDTGEAPVSNPVLNQGKLTGGSTGSGTSSPSSKSSGISFGSVFDLLKGGLKKDGVRNVLGQAINYGFNPCYGQANLAGGLPGYYGTYNTPFGGLPVGYALGYNTNDLILNQQRLSGGNASRELAQGLGLLLIAQPNHPNRKSYEEAIRVLQSNINDGRKFEQVAQLLQQTDFFQTVGNNASTNMIANMFYALCSRALYGNNQIIEQCRNLFNQGVNTPFNPNRNGTLGGATTQAQQLTAIASTFAQHQAGMEQILQEVNAGNCEKYNASVATVRNYRESVLQQVISFKIQITSQISEYLKNIRSQLDRYALACTLPASSLSSASLDASLPGFAPSGLGTGTANPYQGGLTGQTVLLPDGTRAQSSASATANRGYFYFGTARGVTDRYVFRLYHDGAVDRRFDGIVVPVGEPKVAYQLDPGKYYIDAKINQTGVPYTRQQQVLNVQAGKYYCFAAGNTAAPWFTECNYIPGTTLVPY